MARAQPSEGNRISTALRCGAAAVVVMLALAGCRESEQGRVLWYEPGVFKGERHATPLDQGDLAALRERAAQQAGAGGGPTLTGTDIRPPAPKKQ